MCLASFAGVVGPREPPNTCVSMGKLNILDMNIDPRALWDARGAQTSPLEVDMLIW